MFNKLKNLVLDEETPSQSNQPSSPGFFDKIRTLVTDNESDKQSSKQSRPEQLVSPPKKPEPEPKPLIDRDKPVSAEQMHQMNREILRAQFDSERSQSVADPVAQAQALADLSRSQSVDITGTQQPKSPKLQAQTPPERVEAKTSEQVEFESNDGDQAKPEVKTPSISLQRNRPEAKLARANRAEQSAEDDDEEDALFSKSKSSAIQRLRAKRNRGKEQETVPEPEVQLAAATPAAPVKQLSPVRASASHLAKEEVKEQSFASFRRTRQQTDQIQVRRLAQTRRNTSIDQNNSSDSDLTNKSFESNCGEPTLDQDEIEATLSKIQALNAHLRFQNRTPSLPSKAKVAAPQPKILLFERWSETSELPSDSLVLTVQENENMFRNYGEKRLNDQRQKLQSQSLSKFKEAGDTQSVMSEFRHLKFVKQGQGETCIALTNGFLLVGISQGLLHVYCLKTEKLLGTNKPETTSDNAVTAIDVHALRPEFCCVGYQKGHIALINLSQPSKTLKLIKDHHVQAVNQVKFCDWSKEKPHAHLGPDHKCKDCQSVGSWMLLSSDQTGRVVQTVITNLAFGAMFASQTVFVNPDLEDVSENLYQVLCPRMSSRLLPQELAVDNQTVVAIGGSEHVVILVTPEKIRHQKMIIEKPKRYPSQNIEDAMPVMAQFPLLAWGFGKTPRYNWQTFPLLAIGWGPIIQIVVLKQLDAINPIENFELDGFYIISQERAKGKKQAEKLDISLTSLNFIDESLLVGTTTSGEVRVMLTQHFKEREFVPPAHLEELNFAEISDPRVQMLANGQPLQALQLKIELERNQLLPAKLIQARGSPLECQEAVSVLADQWCVLTDQGLFLSHHLNWLESLGDTENQVTLASSWIEIFGKALEIYTGQVQGLRIKDKEMDRQDAMRQELKQLIEKKVVQIIAQWKLRADMNLKAGKMSPNQVQDDLNTKFQTLIRTVIEFCVEIREPIFLFDTLLSKFAQESKSTLFSEELKPYILSGAFAECAISENILSEQILSHHQKTFSENFIKTMTGQRGESVPQAVSPAENFEKILINFRFEECSKDYKLMLIDFCIQYKLTSAMIYLCLSSYEEQGPLQAMTQLKDFYLDTLTNELCGEQLIHKDDLEALRQMPANLFDRILLERSSCYLGYKLLSTAQLFLSGKKFPRGIFSTDQWHMLCHDICELLTANIHHLVKIDAEAFFDILKIVFIQDSAQFAFIKQGRPQSEFYQESMSHELIVNRVCAYFGQIGHADAAHLPYLCFVASVVRNYEAVQTNAKARVCLQTSADLVSLGPAVTEYFHKRLIKSNKGHSEAETVVFVESMIIDLLERSTAVLDADATSKLWAAAESSPFENVKLRVLELQQEYFKCLKLFLGNQTGADKPFSGPLMKDGFQDPFVWITARFEQLEQLAFDTKMQSQKIQLDHFCQDILKNATYLVKQNLASAVQMAEVVFRSSHMEMVDQLKDQKETQLQYIEYYIDTHYEQVKETMMGMPQAAPKYHKARSTAQQRQQMNKLLSLHLRLICDLEPDTVTYRVEGMIRDSFYPMEECLRICRDLGHKEAEALLNKKIGNYQQAIALHLDILYSDLNKERLKKELYFLYVETNKHAELQREKNFQEGKMKFKLQAKGLETATAPNQSHTDMQDVYTAWVFRFGPQVDMLDKSLDKIINICKAHPQQSLQVQMGSAYLWQQVLIFLFDVLTHPSLRFKRYCKRHLKQKIVAFVRCILPFVSFSEIMKQVSATSGTRNLKFRAVKPLMHDVFADKSQEYELCTDAMTTLQRDLLAHIQDVALDASGTEFGLSALRCVLCAEDIRQRGTYKDSWFQSQQAFSEDSLGGAILFACSANGTGTENHAAHRKCLFRCLNEEAERSLKKAKDTSQLEARCLVCFPKNLSLPLSESKVKLKRSGDASSDSEQEPAPAFRKTAIRVARQQKPAQADYDKRMKKFDESVFSAVCLSKRDFQLSKEA